MLKYVDTKVTFSEVPDEITLCINLSNCPHNCEGCHSPYLREDMGTLLTQEQIESLIKVNEGITCVCIMGGDAEPWYVKQTMSCIKDVFPNLKTAWYSGRDALHKVIEENLDYFDYIKLGPYIKDKGPLNNRDTNQRFYKVFHFSNGASKLMDITYKFWIENGNRNKSKEIK